MSKGWMNVAENDDEALKQFLREEGVPEQDLEKELVKLRENAVVSTQARGVLITPDVDKTLSVIFQAALLSDVPIDKDKYLEAKEALWPR